MRGGSMLINLAGGMAARKTLLRRAETGATPVALKILAVAAIGMTAASCSAPQRVASSNRRTIDPKYGVVASPRVVGENDPVPKGGGREMVGKPYVVAGRTYVPRENPSGYVREGLASWYGTAFHGRLTANGEIFDRYSIAAAHPTLPLPSYARVTNVRNKRSIIVRVNDRGPYHANRLMDVSQQVAEALDFRHAGHDSRARRVRRSRLDARQRRQQASSDVASRWAACALSRSSLDHGGRRGRGGVSAGLVARIAA